VLVKNSISINAKELNGPVKILDLGCGDAVIAQHLLINKIKNLCTNQKAESLF
jgi:hypothetical protein